MTLQAMNQEMMEIVKELDIHACLRPSMSWNFWSLCEVVSYRTVHIFLTFTAGMSAL